MTKPEAIKKLFPNKSNPELSEIWKKVFQPEVSAYIGKPFINPGILDELLIEEYGDYNGTLGEFISGKFGQDVLEVVKNQ